ncbi:hypothetical protein BDB01DRAFT_834546 [Pilobolus umbonatus]|nr:hypothetical protein BDB01DRAFT_834546 [Pilobolus umbonatus]
MVNLTHDYDSAEYVQLTKTWNTDPTAYLSRYYTLHYKRVDKARDPLRCHVYVRQSPNKICVLGIHEQDIINRVHSIHMNRDLIGQNVKLHTILCTLKDKEDKEIGVMCAEMDGKLLELNTRLDSPEGPLLLQSHFMDTAHIAIILPKSDDTSVQLKYYLTEEEYKESEDKSKTNHLLD